MFDLVREGVRAKKRKVAEGVEMKIGMMFWVDDCLFMFFSADPSGWWTGRIRGKEGLFPGNYVEKI